MTSTPFASPPVSPLTGAPIALSYQLEGHTEGSRRLASGARVIAVRAFDGASTRTITADFATALPPLLARPRLYADYLVACQVELRLGVHGLGPVTDIRTRRMLEAAGQHRSLIEEELASLRANPISEAQLTYEAISNSVDNPRLDFLLREIELPVIEPTAAMMEAGALVHRPLLEEFVESSGLQVEMRQMQLADLRANPGDGVRAKTVQKELGHYQSIQSNARNLLAAIDAETGRVHPSLDPLGADTGRFSCSSPNLQGLPREMRSCVVAGPGKVLIVADWKQAEMHVLGYWSQDPYLLAAIAQEVDLHTRTAAAVLGIPEADVTEQRDLGKTVNFAIVYGETSYGLSEDLGIGQIEAQELLDAFYRQYSGVYRWSDSVQHFVIRHEYVSTLFGRHRVLPEARSDRPPERDRALRQAVNTVIQGTAAELHKMALVRVHRGLPQGCRLLLPIHDAVLVEVPMDRVAECASVLRCLLEAPLPGFPWSLPVEIKAGRSWGEMVTI